MLLTGTARLGADARMNTAGSGDAVANLSLAFNYGKKGQDGSRPTQWVEASLWGRQAEALEPYLKKGSQVTATLRDVHIETYEGRNGTGYKLVGTVIDIQLVGGRPEGAQQSGGQQQAPAQRQQQQQRPPADDFEDDIPF